MSKGRKKTTADEHDKTSSGGFEFPLKIRDLQALFEDNELYEKVTGGKELVISLDLPEEPSRQDLVDAQNLRDVIEELIQDMEEALQDEGDDEEADKEDVDDEELDEEDED